MQRLPEGICFLSGQQNLTPDSYEGTIDVGEDEKNSDARPELSTHIENLEQYDTVFVGFPNWWYGMPMVMYSFFDEYDFSGKTVIPFCTSGGSAFSDTIDEIRGMEPGAAVLTGFTSEVPVYLTQRAG